VPTTHYRTSLDVRRRLRTQREEAGWQAANIERYLEDVQYEGEIDVWVESAATTEYFDFGVETDIRPTPAAEVMDSDESQRITEEQMRKQLDEYRGEIDEEIEPLPGTFEPSTLGVDSAQSASCLH
jgi:DNA-binding transcriptional MerR regulator